MLDNPTKLHQEQSAQSTKTDESPHKAGPSFISGQKGGPSFREEGNSPRQHTSPVAAQFLTREGKISPCCTPSLVVDIKALLDDRPCTAFGHIARIWRQCRSSRDRKGADGCQAIKRAARTSRVNEHNECLLLVTTSAQLTAAVIYVHLGSAKTGRRTAVRLPSRTIVAIRSSAATPIYTENTYSGHAIILQPVNASV